MTPLSAHPDQPTGATLKSTEPVSGRRTFLREFVGVAAALVVAPIVARQLHAESAPASANASSTAPVKIHVYKDKSCGCCKEWVKHMEKAGFAVTAEDSPNMEAIKKKLGVPTAMGSCHTAVVGDYLVEGHVPADIVQIMLKEKPAALGLAVPGMPQGSPGMEGPVKEKYNVMLFERSGKSRVYASR